ncbi:MAG: BatA domain-containing protein [Planctomycetota bacterium]
MTSTLAQLAGLFTAPALAVAGAACVAIPIVIHLLSRSRRRRADWGAMRFLRLAYKKQRRKLRLEKWLLLLTRCAIMLIAGLALAGPLLSGALGGITSGGGGRTVHLVLDDGLSSRALVGEGVRFDRLRELADGLLDGLGGEDRVQLWTVSPGDGVAELGSEPTYDIAAVREVVRDLTPGYGRSDLAATLTRVAAEVDAEASAGGGGGVPAVVAVLSDFPRGASYLDQPVPAELENLGDKAAVVVSRPEVGTGNVQVSDLRPRRALVLTSDRGVTTASVEVAVRRFDDNADEAVLPIQLTLTRPDGTEASRVTRDVRWSAGQATTTLSADLPLRSAGEIDSFSTLTAPGVEGGGVWTVTATLEGAAGVADALREDNVRLAVVEVRPRLRVGVIDELDASSGFASDGFSPGAFVRAALSPQQTGAAFSVATQDVLPTSVNDVRLADLDAALVLRPETLGASAWTALGGFAQRGGLVWVFPSASSVAGNDWFGLMRSATGVAWELGEAAEPAGAGARRLDSDPRPPEALLLLSADWSALLGPVRATRWLAVTTPRADESWIDWAGDAQGEAFLAAAPVGEGRLLLLATAIDPAWTNLPTKPLFPALLHDALRGVLGQVVAAGGEGATVGERPELGRRWSSASVLVSGEALVPLDTNADGGGVTTLEPLAAPGVYAPRQGELGQRLAVNVPAEAGDVRTADAALVKAWLDGLGPWATLEADRPAAVLATAQRTSNFGWVLLWLLLGLVLLETVLARWFSYASSGQRGDAGQATEASANAGRNVKRGWWSSRAALWSGLGCCLVAQPQAAVAQPWLDGWLGLNEVSWSEATAVGFRYALPAWAWVLIGIGALGAAWWSYRRLLGPTWARVGLAGLRGLLILLIAVLLAGPEVVRTDETVEQDVLLVLVDRSASMNVADVPSPSSEGATESAASLVSRDEAMRSALKTQGDVFGPDKLGRDRQVTWLGFGESAFDLAPPIGDESVDRLPEPTADTTALRTALEEALRRAAGRPISGIVLMTDGRSPEATGGALLNRLEQQSVRVFAVPLGAERLPLDLMIARVDPPTAAFVNDPVPVTVVVEQPGVPAENQVDPARVTVRLIDTNTQDIVDEKTLGDTGFGRPLRLEGRSSEVGALPWAVEVIYDGSAADERELNLTNNVESFTVEMIDRPIRVLYIEGYPRWEYRYLKNMLIREQSIDSSIFLLSADRAFAQEGDTPITRLPSGSEEWRRYDVVILGDVSPEAFSIEQRKQLFDLVAQRGAGLLWVGGSRATPTAYGATLLSDLLPMREPETSAVLPSAALRVTPTDLAETLSVLQLRSVDAGVAERGPQWPEGLPTLRWVQDLGNLKPSAEVLATASSVTGDVSGDPLVTRLRFGAGQSLYVGTDETWRWRYARGEVYFEQFWVQLVRLLGRGAATRSDDAVRMSVSARQTPRGGTVVVDVDIDDAALLARDLPSLRVAVRKQDDGDGVAVAEFDLRPVNQGSGDDLSGAGRRYSSPWLAGVSGALDLVVTEPALSGFDLRLPIEVVAPDDERRRAEADVPRLVKLAEDTGGRVVPLDDLTQLTEPGVVRNLARKTANDVAEPIWNSALALALVVGLITLEWVVRKLIRLV